jgi:hypothetical protein
MVVTQRLLGLTSGNVQSICPSSITVTLICIAMGQAGIHDA